MQASSHANHGSHGSHASRFVPYDHGGDIYGNPGVVLDFSVNTNPLGMPPAVRAALLEQVDAFARYPDPYCRALCAAIAQSDSVPPEWVLCGNGAADLIYRLTRALEPRSALVVAPGFSEYEKALACVPSKVRHHTLTQQNEFLLTEELAGELTPEIDVLFLCNPNNPTGRLIPGDLLAHLLERAQQTHITVIVDECFLDFTSGVSCSSYLESMPSLVILKAFTKMYSMAGLRLGYLLSSNETLLGKIARGAQCWSVSVPAQVAGVAALSNEAGDWQKETRALVALERAFLRESLHELGIKTFASEANYLLLQSELPLYSMLLQRGLMLRTCDTFAGLDSTYYRIAIKTHEENLCLLAAMREALREVVHD